jgi:hypothetical protein
MRWSGCPGDLDFSNLVLGASENFDSCKLIDRFPPTYHFTLPKLPQSKNCFAWSMLTLQGRNWFLQASPVYRAKVGELRPEPGLLQIFMSLAVFKIYKVNVGRACTLP